VGVAETPAGYDAAPWLQAAIRTGDSRGSPILKTIKENLGSRAFPLRSLRRKFLRVTGDGPVVARKIFGEGGKGGGDGFALAPYVRKRKCQKRSNRAVQCIVRGAQLGCEHCDCFLRISKIPERAGHLNDRAPATLSYQASLKGCLVQRHREIGATRRIARAGAFKVPDRAFRRQLCDQSVDERHKLILAVVIDGFPQVRNLLFPICSCFSHNTRLCQRRC